MKRNIINNKSIYSGYNIYFPLDIITLQYIHVGVEGLHKNVLTIKGL